MEIQEIFPYPSFRRGQRELAESVYDACRNHRQLVIEAMSGFGKTAPVLSGSLLAARETKARIVYACRTKRQVFRVMEELAKIQRKVPVRTAYLFSKNDYCLLKEFSKFTVTQEAFKWYCSFNTTNNMCSYFLNVTILNREMRSLVEELSACSTPHSELLSQARRLHVCPYEVARLAIMSSTIVVTTYSYLFDQASRSVLFANTNTSPSETCAIVDEAHNIRDFVRDSATTALSLAELEGAINDSKNLYLDNLATSLRQVLDALRAVSVDGGSWRVDKTKLAELIRRDKNEAWMPNLALELSSCASVGWESVATGKNVPASLLRVGSFIENFLSSLELPEKTIVKSDHSFFLVDTDPSGRFTNVTKDFGSLVLLSGTINPSDLFLKSIGLSESTQIHKVNLDHTFNVKTIVDIGVSTSLKSRDPKMYEKIASKISAICDSVEGGIGIFAPSYAFLGSINQMIRDRVHGREILTEVKNMDNQEADKIMQTFKSTSGSILLAVQGGRFSEGEDFPGDQMDVSVVVGLPLAPPSPTMYAEYAQTRFTKHEAYLVISLLPALRRAIQSAGRHMRSPDKKGMVFFLDSRFNNREALAIMPSWLKQEMLTGDFSPAEVRELIGSFWSRDGPL